MKTSFWRYTLTLLICTIVFGAVATPTLAHEQQSFTIGDKTYNFVIGSLNEPVYVGDKTGIELRITQVNQAKPNDPKASGVASVVGLEKTLKAEVVVGESKKEFPLVATYGDPGTYKAYFIPTVETTYIYRITGTINSVPVDLSFGCNPAGHAKAEESTEVIEVSNSVKRIYKTGAFGCPSPREDLMFPDPTIGHDGVDEFNTPTSSQIADDAKAATRNARGALLIAIIALVASLTAGRKIKG